MIAPLLFFSLLAGCFGPKDPPASAEHHTNPVDTDTAVYQMDTSNPADTAVTVDTDTAVYTGGPGDTGPEIDPATDDDGDGYTVGGDDGDNYTHDKKWDCDDANPDIHPKADERCNYVDDDCNGLINDGCSYECDNYTKVSSDSHRVCRDDLYALRINNDPTWECRGHSWWIEAP